VINSDYRSIRDSLVASYEDGADRRDNLAKPPWKLAERDAFLARMRAEACVGLLEIGAGTGQDSAYFASQSFEVVDFHVVTTTGEHGFQSLTLRRPGREAARSMTR